MFFKIKKLNKEIKKLKFDLEVQTRCHNDWFESWKATLTMKWALEEELREVKSELYASQVKIEMLENKLDQPN